MAPIHCQQAALINELLDPLPVLCCPASAAGEILWEALSLEPGGLEPGGWEAGGLEPGTPGAWRPGGLETGWPGGCRPGGPLLSKVVNQSIMAPWGELFHVGSCVGLL